MNRKTKIKYLNWDDKRAGVNFLYAMAANSTAHWERTKTFCDWMLPGGGAEYTPRGLLFLNEWGTLGTIQNKLHEIWRLSLRLVEFKVGDHR